MRERDREQEQKPDPFLVFYLWMLSCKEMMFGAAATTLHPKGSPKADPEA